MSLPRMLHLLPPRPPPTLRPSTAATGGQSPPPAAASVHCCHGNLPPTMAPVVLTLSVAMAIASPALPSPALPSPSPTPYSLSQTLQLGLENGTIRACPSTNPGCVSTNPLSPSFLSPWFIPENSSAKAVQELRDAVLTTQKNVVIKVDQETVYGHYLQVEVDGSLFSRDVMEFLVTQGVACYRTMATKVTYVYPFTTAIGDSKGQQERVKKIQEELGWYSPDIEIMGS